MTGTLPRRLILSGVLTFAAGLTLHILVPIAFGRPRPIIQVAWADGAARVELEQRFHLVNGRPADSGFQAYAIYDTSSANLRGLVQHPSVSSVRNVTGDPFRIAPDTPVSERRDGWIGAPRWVSGGIRRLAAILMLAGGLLLLTAPVAHALAGRPATWRVLGTVLLGWLTRGIPPASAKAAAAFRIPFALALVAFFAVERVYPELLESYDALDVSRRESPYSALVGWLAARPAVVQGIEPFLLTAATLVAAGAFTRVVYPALVLGTLVWSCIYTVNFSAHTVTALQLTMIGLLVARWDDAWSVDAWLRRRMGRPRPPASALTYGFTFWLPTFVLGVTFAAAAWSKAKIGPAWILNGSVKYHLVSDWDHAWVDWGIQLTRYGWIAIAMSAAAVLIESLMITAAFSRWYGYRLTLGLGALLLLTGFVLFQGIVWAGWWLLLLGFLPWHRIGDADAAAETASPFPRTLLIVMLAIGGQQIVMSMLQIEARPLLSAYDMYSATYDSPEDYEAASNLQYRVVAISPAGSIDLPGCIVSDRAADAARRAVAGAAEDRAALRELIGRCVREHPEVQAVALEGDRRVFDWAESRFRWKRRLDSIGPIDVRWLRP